MPRCTSLLVLVLISCRGEDVRQLPASSLRFEPSNLHFPPTEVGSVSQLSFWVISTTPQPTEVTLSTSGDFSVNPSAITLVGGSREQVSVAFAPSAAVLLSSTLRVSTSAYSEELPLSAEGLPATPCVPHSSCEAVQFDARSASCARQPLPDGTSCSNACLDHASCQSGSCVGSPRNCEDNNLCTLDSCDPKRGCSYGPINCPASDDPCQAAYCEPSAGCSLRSVADGTLCGLATCNSTRVCINGSCLTRFASSPCRVRSLAAGYQHTCLVTNDGAIRCWGSNYHGQLGDSTQVDHATAVAVTGLDAEAVEVVAGGVHTCALTLAGGVRCWGNGYSGELGIGHLDLSPSPVDVLGLGYGVAAIAAGTTSTGALTLSGAVKQWGVMCPSRFSCWTTGFPLSPVNVPIGANVQALAMGEDHACALTGLGRVRCWGSNNQGQLGAGVLGAFYMAPIDDVSLGEPARAIATGSLHSCALTRGGKVLCWGASTSGQLGDGGNSIYRLTPVEVIGLPPGIQAVAAGAYHSCALTAVGGVKCWGSNQFGQLGVFSSGFVDRVPVDVLGLQADVQVIAAGPFHNCAATSAGKVLCWGANESGQIGNGAIAPAEFRPQEVLLSP